MSYKMVYYGSEILRQQAQEINNIDQNIIDLIDTMYNIMYREKGVGLAGPQVNFPGKLVTIDIEVYDGPSIVLINPEITARSEETVPYEEGCLSLPGIAADIIRPSEVSVKAIDRNGKEIKIDADGMYARVLQHEIDHLNGKVFIDHLEDYMRKELTSKLKKIKKLNR